MKFDNLRRGLLIYCHSNDTHIHSYLFVNLHCFVNLNILWQILLLLRDDQRMDAPKNEKGTRSPCRRLMWAWQDKCEYVPRMSAPWPVNFTIAQASVGGRQMKWGSEDCHNCLMMTEVKGQSRGSESNGTENLLCNPARKEDCSILQTVSGDEGKDSTQSPPGQHWLMIQETNCQTRGSYLLSSFGTAI